MKSSRSQLEHGNFYTPENRAIDANLAGMARRETPVDKVDLHVPPLDKIRDILSVGLAENFGRVSVEVVECPDLTAAPFGLAAPGLCGDARIADVGGVPNLTPTPKPEKVYSLTNVLKTAEMEDGAIIGPGAANSHFVG